MTHFPLTPFPRQGEPASSLHSTVTGCMISVMARIAGAAGRMSS